MGGEWQLLEDKFLVGAGNTYTLGATGGEATVTIGQNNLPSRTVVRTSAGCNTWSNSPVTEAAVSQGTFSTHCLIDGKNESYGQAMTNLPPYQAVYMWERTA